MNLRGKLVDDRILLIDETGEVVGVIEDGELILETDSGQKRFSLTPVEYECTISDEGSLDTTVSMKMGSD